ncbi:MAG: DtxR family transcriptional regulator [Synergistaceae bacterium]|nr:iron dependent repressor, metal binding and dimerization domain protein [Synergistota bacterium]NLM71078.1 DtxR family transcriptional regulator [Synergistaceae bacterium]
MSVSSRSEDYLEAIFAIEVSGREATITDLASALGVTKATTVSAVRRLVDASFATQERYGTPSLTDEGRKRALEIFRRHEHLTFLFHEVLGFEPERAMSLACVMEHELDEESERRILGFVDYIAEARREGCPWVAELLSAMGDERKLSRPLAMLDDGGCGVVSRVTAGGLLRRKLFDAGFVPGSEVCRFAASESGEELLLSVDGDPKELRKKEAVSVWICPVAEPLSADRRTCASEEGEG